MYTTKRDERKKKNLFLTFHRLTTESCTPKTITGGLRIWVLSERKETTLFCRSSSRQKLNQRSLNRRGHESGKDGGGKDFRGGGSAFELTNVEGRGRGEMLDSSTGSVGQRKRGRLFNRPKSRLLPVGPVSELSEKGNWRGGGGRGKGEER